jgi:eukaryotic-like serine/threonine-protein kinase
MKPATMTLTVVEGRLQGTEYIFDGQARCLIGRAEDCDVRLPLDLEHANVSRHHCLLEIDPPEIRIRDLGSRNGTFVNGALIGQRSHREEAENADPDAFPAHELRDGDTVRIGHTVFQVHVAAAKQLPESSCVPMYFV